MLVSRGKKFGRGENAKIFRVTLVESIFGCSEQIRTVTTADMCDSAQRKNGKKMEVQNEESLTV